jgi:hypothetical protein
VTQQKVSTEVTIEEVLTVLGLASTYDFSNIQLYFAITYVDSSGESTLADSPITTVPPVGIVSAPQKDDPTANRHIFGWSEDIYRWVKIAASTSGGLATDTSDYFKANTTTEYTYDGTNLSTVKSYLTDMTAAGSPAKLITYEYDGGNVSKVTITDSTV